MWGDNLQTFSWMQLSLKSQRPSPDFFMRTLQERLYAGPLAANRTFSGRISLSRSGRSASGNPPPVPIAWSRSSFLCIFGGFRAFRAEVSESVIASPLPTVSIFTPTATGQTYAANPCK